ncbi:MAG: hypothetical protein KF752_16010 [Pirellulaceae bacterium]|nr:hypothetical protein [Pirellulaceae bacterium]
MTEPQTPQPLLPRFTMRWYFVTAAIIGVLITLIARSVYQQSLVAVGLLLLLATGMYLTFSALAFFAAYSVGAMEKLAGSSQPQPESPFAQDTLPPQLLPPSTR